MQKTFFDFKQNHLENSSAQFWNGRSSNIENIQLQYFLSEVDMTHLIRNNDEEVVEGNTHYYKLTKLLPDGVTQAQRMFKLHSTTWVYTACVFDGDLYISNDSLCNDIEYIHRLFKIRIGIASDDLKEIIAAFNVGILSHKRLLSRSQLDTILLTKKSLHLFIEIRRKDEGIQKMKVRKQKMEADYRELLLSGRNSDVTIEVKHKKFNCHRCILRSRSTVFAAMFDHDMKEKVNGVVTIEDTEPAVFQEFLLYLYSGNDDHLSWENILELYKLAEKYGIEDLKIVCMDDVKKNINESNFFKFFQVSLLNNDSSLTEIVIQFFIRESWRILRGKTWSTHLSENPVECNILMAALSNSYRITNP